MEVRCCCQPTKLLGWIDGVREDALRVAFRLRPIQGAAWDQWGALMHQNETISLTIATIVTPQGQWRAIKAEGVPIETLRRVPGFIEA